MALHPLRKLLVLGLNEALARGLVTLDATQEANGHTFVQIAGRGSVVLWRDIGHGELRLSVWWGFDLGRHPQAEDERFITSVPLAKRSRYREFVDVLASGFVERRTSPHLQGKGGGGLFDTYARRYACEVLAGIPDPVPAGFAVSGRFFR